MRRRLVWFDVQRAPVMPDGARPVSRVGIFNPQIVLGRRVVADDMAGKEIGMMRCHKIPSMDAKFQKLLSPRADFVPSSIGTVTWAAYTRPCA